MKGDCNGILSSGSQTPSPGEDALGRTHIVGEELQHKSSHTAIDTNEEVHTSKDHIGIAGDLEHEGSWVHEGCDRPPDEAQKNNVYWLSSAFPLILCTICLTLCQTPPPSKVPYPYSRRSRASTGRLVEDT